MERSILRLSLWWSLLLLSGKNGVFSAGGQPKIVTTILEAPFVMLKPASDGETRQGNDLYEGFCIDLLQVLSQKAGFNYTIRPVKDGRYGVLSSDGNWSGMIGELVRREADLAVAPLTITSAREQVVDFSKPFLSTGIAIMMKHPSSLPTVAELSMAILRPFPVGIWIGLLVACPTIGLLLFLFARFNPVENQQSPSGNASPRDEVTAATTNRFNLSDSLWFSVKTMLQQGTNTDPRSVSSRILSAVWWIFVVVVVAAYTANLVVIANKAKAEDWSHIKSASDLAEQTDVSYGTLGSGSTNDFFKKSSIDVYQKMWNRMSSSSSKVFVDSVEQGVEKVRTSGGKYAFLGEATMIDYYSSRKPCDTVKVGANLDAKGYGIATPRGSDLSNRITLAILELIEMGEVERLWRKWWVERGECPSDSIQGIRSHLVNVRGAFYLLFFGVIIAVVSAVFEFLYWRKRQSANSAAKDAAASSADGSNKV